jgi:hypothetical protein
LSKKVLRIARSATTGAAERELGRESRRGKILDSVAKYWARTRIISYLLQERRTLFS